MSEQDFIRSMRRFRRRCWTGAALFLAAAAATLIFDLVTGGFGR